MRRVIVRALAILAVPFVLGGLARLRCLVDHAAGADDLAQEGVRAGAMVLAGGIADGC